MGSDQFDSIWKPSQAASRASGRNRYPSMTGAMDEPSAALLGAGAPAYAFFLTPIDTVQRKQEDRDRQIHEQPQRPEIAISVPTGSKRNAAGAVPEQELPQFASRARSPRGAAGVADRGEHPRSERL
jgi:hypothetical protein